MAPTPRGPRPSGAGPAGLTRRGLLTGGLTVAAGAVAGAAYAHLSRPAPEQLGPVDSSPGFVPDAPEGRVRLETVTSTARGRDVQLFTAVPAGYGDGAGLPVVVVLHGATGRAADFRPFGFPRFLTAAVRGGAPPFVLAGADGGSQYWEPDPQTGDDPQEMVLAEIPGWLEQRGFGAARRALWGWSMGGYGSMRIAQVSPGWARAVAAFSPAVRPGDSVFDAAEALSATPLGIWCGTKDRFYDATRALVEVLPRPPAIAVFGPGGHTRSYWSEHTLRAFRFLSGHLQG